MTVRPRNLYSPPNKWKIAWRKMFYYLSLGKFYKIIKNGTKENLKNYFEDKEISEISQIQYKYDNINLSSTAC